MFNFKALLAATLAAPLSVASASPVTASPDASPSIEVCTSITFTGCLTIPIVSSACVDLTGGLAGFNEEISLAIIPDGFICTFFEAFACSSTANEVILQGGTTNFDDIHFNDLTSSFTCSPII
ncbi:hypothetical protein C8R45DRAFT_1104930 [Mycena sanguinolenta]|nr:hypothetical protein C8R45DRAFT_1104930 [Mycena sanguinolenta]